MKLQAQPAKVLSLLVRHHGHQVSRQALQEHVWEDQLVDFDQGLNYCIRQIRTALGDSASQPVYIETVPRSGYRFIAPVEQAVASQEEAREAVSAGKRTAWMASAFAAVGLGIFALSLTFSPRLAPDSGQERPARIAVLPFSDFSDQGDLEYFSYGVTDDLIHELNRLDPDQLVVIGSMSVRRYSAMESPLEVIGKELDVDFLVEGSLRGGGDDLWINARLVHAGDGTLVWSQRYPGSPASGSRFQLEIARAIVAELAPDLVNKISKAPFDGDESAAKRATLLGRFLLNRGKQGDPARARAEFEKALEVAPEYAPALVELSRAHQALGENTSALTAIARAIRLDPDLPRAHRQAGALALFVEWNWAAASESLQRALELAPGDADTYHLYAIFLESLGRSVEAVEFLEQALLLDPASPAVAGDLCWIYRSVGRHQQAILECERTLMLEPRALYAFEALFEAFRETGQVQRALNVARRFMEANGADRSDIRAVEGHEGETAFRSWRLAWLKERRRSGETVDPTQLALAYCDLEQIDSAFAALEEAFELHSSTLVFLKAERRYAPLRSDPRFATLLARIGFPGS